MLAPLLIKASTTLYYVCRRFYDKFNDRTFYYFDYTLVKMKLKIIDYLPTIHEYERRIH